MLHCDMGYVNTVGVKYTKCHEYACLQLSTKGTKYVRNAVGAYCHFYTPCLPLMSTNPTVNVKIPMKNTHDVETNLGQFM